MNKRKTTGRILILLCCVSVLFIGAGSPEKESQKARNQIFIATGGMTGKHFNPIWLTCNPQFMTLPLILPALTWFDNQIQPVPHLAEKVEANDDATSYTFHLPKNATWSDGEKLDAEDVYFTYKLATSPDAVAAQSTWSKKINDIVGMDKYQKGEADEIEGIVIVDEHTIRFDLKTPNGVFLLNTYLGILPQHILKDLSFEEFERSSYVDAPTVTSGLYEFVEYVPDQYIHLKKRENYWGKEAEIGEVFVKLIDDDATRLAQLEAGEVDIAQIPADETDRLRSLARLDVIPVDGVGYLVTHVDARSQAQIDHLNLPPDKGGKGGNPLNSKPIEREVKPYLLDKRFRQALAYAADTEAIISVMDDGFAKPIYSPIFGPEWALNPNLNKYEKNDDRAKQLLTEAGCTFTDKGVAMWAGEEVEVIILGTTGERARQLGEVLQQNFGDVGIQCKLVMVTSSAFLNAAIGGDGDLIINAGGRFGVDPSVSSAYYKSQAGWAQLVMGFSNPRFDELMDKGVQTNDLEERKAIYFEASAILNEELPSLFFSSQNYFIGKPKNLSGFLPSKDVGYITWNIADWSFSP